jgi:CBS domain-containing protein
MIFEQTNSYQIILPLMFVCIVSHATVRVLGGRSLNDEALRRRGVKLPSGPEAGVMQSVHVREVMHDEVVAVPESAQFAEVVDQFLKQPHNNLYVVDAAGKYVGAIRLHALKDLLDRREELRVVVARDLVDESFPFVTPDQKLADTMEVFWRETAERLPVLNNDTDRRLVGWMSKRDLIGVYSQEILQKRQLLARFAVRSGTEQREAFVELPEGFELRTIEVPAAYEGITLAQLAPRSQYGVYVLVLKRRNPVTGQDAVQIPGADLRLNADDRLVVVGQFENIAQFIAALALPPV